MSGERREKKADANLDEVKAALREVIDGTSTIGAAAKKHCRGIRSPVDRAWEKLNEYLKSDKVAPHPMSSFWISEPTVPGSTRHHKDRTTKERRFLCGVSVATERKSEMALGLRASRLRHRSGCGQSSVSVGAPNCAQRHP